MPQQAAGSRIEPPVSEPSAPNASRAATADAGAARGAARDMARLPRIVDVAVVRVVTERAERQLGHVQLAERHRAGGRAGGPPRWSRDRSGSIRRSWSRTTWAGPPRGRDPCTRAGRRAVARGSLPAPDRRRALRARASAPGASTVMNACRRPSRRAMRSRQACVASTAETLRAAMAPASSTRVRSVTRSAVLERDLEVGGLLGERRDRRRLVRWHPPARRSRPGRQTLSTDRARSCWPGF